MLSLSIHGKELSIPLIQGGMGVGVSLERLAGSVAREGGMGCISTADCGYREENFATDPEGANLKALTEEIEQARVISKGKGMIAINAMVATRQFEQAVRTAVKAGIDAVISGAGLPLDLPGLVPKGAALIAPIVSSGRAIRLICKTWWKKAQRLPDFVVLEGPKAGGHLGFKESELLQNTCRNVLDILSDVKKELQPFEEAAKRRIPVCVAGGIWDRADVTRAKEAGADGVQMATRFIATEECDASQGYKDVLLSASRKELKIIHSPVGMPGRAVVTPMLRRLETEGRIPPLRCSRCIKTCQVNEVAYCITHALIEAVKGNREEGLFFCGSNVDRLTEMSTVHEVVTDLF
ncbi:NAD(P)H-dependent flavin oxidoreductase YrpB, nitropropane dioxygenase family [Lachnospiraceae bacterium KHCPX20]|nr:NAD(P)H-dependent flavin oxidoreductase YrpB, nitropropane dioxygenase family [Lachnospiraceae bacterium KHCPX20]